MEYITVAEAAKKWGVTPRQVQRLLAAGRIPDAKKHGCAFMIPADAEKPGDPRFEKKTPQNSLLSDLAEVVEAITLPLPSDNPVAVLDIVKDEHIRAQYEASFAYFRGDFEHTKRCYQKMEGNDASRLCACHLAIAAAISTGDYPFYIEIETYLKKFIEADINPYITIIAEFALNTAYVNAIAPNMVAGWLKDGDFSMIPPKARADAANKRAKYFQSIGNYNAMLTVAQTALAFCDSMLINIYLHVLCAIAQHELSRPGEVKRHLSEALKMALPHGFITPFAETVINFGGLLDQLLKQEYPEYYDAVINQWKRTIPNWITFHNRFTKGNITLILSLREYQIAQLVARGVPYKKIAEQFHISVGTLKNIMTIIYETLLITEKNRKRELAKYVL